MLKNSYLEKTRTTMAENNRTVLDSHIISESGCQVNSSGGLYKQSTVTTVEKYVVTVNKYEEMCAFDRTKNVSFRTIANDVKVDWNIAKKTILLHESGVGYEGMDMGRFRASKVGDRVDMDADDEPYILWFCFEDPFRPNASYFEKMWKDMGRHVIGINGFTMV